ncbi:putative UDP-3-O-acylglucosamine N-acyltransferase 2, mitochondrial [Capsicum annuum]|nr:putative UDP-3-O-acylglucosamine N-acyltransferase 2, mitochondrial [Capsicum annuum]
MLVVIVGNVVIVIMMAIDIGGGGCDVKLVDVPSGTTVHLKCALDSNFENGGENDRQDYYRWSNGGGTFHKSASIDPSAFVEVGAVVHSECAVGADCHIDSGAIIGPTVTLGHSTKIGYNVALANCMIGDFCVIHSGVCIGQDGFGFYVDEQGNMVKKPQILKARIENHVEIGANTCIDRGSTDRSQCSDWEKLPHLWTSWRSGFSDGIFCITGKILPRDQEVTGSSCGKSLVQKCRVRLAANSCVTKDISEPGDYGGFPAIPIRDWRRQIAKHRQNLK